MENTTDILTNAENVAEDVTDVVDEVISETAPSMGSTGSAIMMGAAGAAVIFIGAYAMYKYVCKPVYFKIKEKKEAKREESEVIENGENDVVNHVDVEKVIDLNDKYIKKSK